MKSGFVFALAVLSSGTAVAQEMRPLVDAVGDAAAPYAPARCGGLYQAMMEWVGADRMGTETWEATDAARQNQILLSAMIAQQSSGGTLEDQVEVAIRDVRNIADLYITRMERNYALSGQAFAEDELISSDLELCGALSESISAVR